jgi:ABC-2 type transport system ATP-binding protein
LYGRRIIVQLVSVTDAICQAVAGLPFVKQVEQSDSSLLVSLDNPEEQNPVLIERIVAAGGAVQFVTELRHSLEDVYFTLLQEREETGA